MGTISTLVYLGKINFPIVTKEDIKFGYRYLTVDLSRITDFEILTRHLIDYVEYLLIEIETLLRLVGKRIEKFTIGKTYAISKKNHRCDFNGGNSEHFTIAGISDRFRTTYQKEDYNFLLGIVIITRHNIPYNTLPPFNTQQTLTLALESQLIQHFAFVKRDNRIGNTSLHPGNQSSQEYAGGVIYLAVKTCEVNQLYPIPTNLS